MGTAARQDTWRVDVTVDGRFLGTFDKFSGGDIDSPDTKYKPGGMATEITIGGPATVNNVTVSRLYDRARDHDLCRRLTNRVGKADVIVVKQPLDDDGNAWGSPMTYRGKLKKINAPDVDSTASSPSMWEIEVSTAGTIA